LGKIFPYSSSILKGIVKMNIECFGGIKMEEMKKMEKLLRDYGYPEKAIPRLMREISSMNYEKVKKLILPYNDMTAGRS
jgi:hypothetical protein